MGKMFGSSEVHSQITAEELPQIGLPHLVLQDAEHRT